MKHSNKGLLFLILFVQYVLVVSPVCGQVVKGPSRYNIEFRLDHFLVKHTAEITGDQECFGVITAYEFRTGEKVRPVNVVRMWNPTNESPAEGSGGPRLADPVWVSNLHIMKKGKNTQMPDHSIRQFPVFEGLSKEEVKNLKFGLMISLGEFDPIGWDEFVCVNCESTYNDGSNNTLDFSSRIVDLSWPSTSRSIDAILRGESKALTIGNDKYLDLNMMVDPSDPKKGYTQVRFQIIVTRT